MKADMGEILIHGRTSKDEEAEIGWKMECNGMGQACFI